MSPAQESVFSILESIALHHDTYISLKQDRRYQTWIKHVAHKKRMTTFFKDFYAHIEDQKREAQKRIPLYF